MYSVLFLTFRCTSRRFISRLAPDEDSQFAATRYVPAIKSILTDLCNDELSIEAYPSVTPMPATSSTPAGRSSGARNSTVSSARKSTTGAASSVRKPGAASSKWAANSSSLGSSASSGASRGGPLALTGARNIVFMVGGLSYSEMRVAREVMEQSSREIIIGSTSFLSASEFIDDLGMLCR
jgi:syntaxin-binding protein 1